MSEQRLRSFTDEVRGRVVPADFDAIVATAGRRRRTGYVAAAVGTAAIVVVGVLVTQGGQPGHRGSAPPVEQPRITEPIGANDLRALSPEAVANDPRALLGPLAVAPGDSGATASIWLLCDEGCRHFRQVLSITGPAGGSVTELANLGDTDLVALADDSFYLRVGTDHRVIDVSGSGVPLQIDAEPRPVGEGEIVTYGGGYIAVDPVTGAAHALSVPAGLDLVLQQPSGTLQGSGTQRNVMTSTDGGATWVRRYLDDAETSLTPVPSADAATLASLEQDGLALPNPYTRPSALTATWRSTDDGQTWERIPVDSFDGAASAPEITGAVVAPDGSLLVLVSGWPNETDPGARSRGLYSSAGDDWTHFAPVAQPLPEGFVDDPTVGIPLLPLVTHDAGPEVVQTIYVSDPRQNVFATSDGGQTWRPVTVR